MMVTNQVDKLRDFARRGSTSNVRSSLIPGALRRRMMDVKNFGGFSNVSNVHEILLLVVPHKGSNESTIHYF